MKNLAKYLLTGIMMAGSIMPATPTKNSLESKLNLNIVEPVPITTTYENNIIQFPIEEIIQEKKYMKELKREQLKQKELDSNVLEISKIIYAEAADQREIGWAGITKIIMNREESPNYPNRIKDVLYQPGAFSCIGDKNNNNWNQATGETPMNGYEKIVFGRIQKEVKKVLNGKEVKISNADKIIAYHDWSIHKPKDNYWNSLDSVHEDKKLIFYAPKKDLEEATFAYTAASNNDKENNELYNSNNNIIDAKEKFGLLAKATEIKNNNSNKGLLARAQEYLLSA